MFLGIKLPRAKILSLLGASWPPNEKMRCHIMNHKSPNKKQPDNFLIIIPQSDTQVPRVARLKDLSLHIHTCQSSLCQIEFQVRIDLKNLIWVWPIVKLCLSPSDNYIWEITISTVSVSTHGNQICKEIGMSNFFDQAVSFFSVYFVSLLRRISYSFQFMYFFLVYI